MANMSSYLTTTHPPIQRSIRDVCAVLFHRLTSQLNPSNKQKKSRAQRDAHLNELLTPRITRIQLDRCEPREFRDEMGARRLAYPGRTGEHDAAEDVHPVFARLFEVRFQGVWPNVKTGRMGEDRRVDQGQRTVGRSKD